MIYYALKFTKWHKKSEKTKAGIGVSLKDIENHQMHKITTSKEHKISLDTEHQIISAALKNEIGHY